MGWGTDFSGKRILVVEDEQIVAWDLQNLLRRIGHIPLGPAVSGLEAIRMAAETKPDLILMDVHLEGAMDGVQAAIEIARILPVPVIYITGYLLVFVDAPSNMRYPYLCVAKPFSPAALDAAVQSALRLSPAHPA